MREGGKDPLTGPVAVHGSKLIPVLELVAVGECKALVIWRKGKSPYPCLHLAGRAADHGNLENHRGPRVPLRHAEVEVVPVG
jgi:hypothetical protein